QFRRFEDSGSAWDAPRGSRRTQGQRKSPPSVRPVASLRDGRPSGGRRSRTRNGAAFAEVVLGLWKRFGAEEIGRLAVGHRSGLPSSATSRRGPLQMPQHRNRRYACSVALTAIVALTGCGQEEVKYEPKPAPSGAKADLPPVPNVPQKPIKSGDAYTVWGASYYLRNRVHRKEVADQKISITGHIIKTNLLDAPECAVHRGGKADPEGCVAPVPTFWIADSADAAIHGSIK